MAATEAEVLATRLDSARRMVAHIRDGTSDLAPEPMVNLASTYTDPARHAREREVLFARTPQFACLSTEIAAPGAFRTFDEAGPPVIVARGRDGTVRAFLNICPHRGARLVREQWAKANRFTCWFHGWTYANDGRLIAATEAERFGEAGLEGRDVGFAQRDWAAWVDKPESEWGLRPEPASIHLIYPNVVLFAGSVSPGKSYLTIFRHYPGETPGETKTHKTIYAMGGVKDEAHRKEVEDAFGATAHVVVTEDYLTAAEGWRNLTFLPPDATVVYGRQELAQQQMHRNFAEALGEPICAPAHRAPAGRPVSRAGSLSALGEVMQLAYVPADFDAALRFWTETMGAGPFWLLEHVKLEDLHYEGRPSEVDFSMVIGYWGDLQIELIRQHDDAPSIYKAWRDAGSEGLHHVCILVDDMAHARAACAEAGARVVQEGKVSGGGEVIYVDTGGGPGTMAECAAFLASDAASFVTGSEFLADGGWLAAGGPL